MPLSVIPAKAGIHLHKDISYAEVQHWGHDGNHVPGVALKVAVMQHYGEQEEGHCVCRVASDLQKRV